MNSYEQRYESKTNNFRSFLAPKFEPLVAQKQAHISASWAVMKKRWKLRSETEWGGLLDRDCLYWMKNTR